MKYGIICLLISMIVLCFVNIALSDSFYSWVDANGKRHFGDSPNTSTAVNKLTEIPVYKNAERPRYEPTIEDIEEELSSAEDNLEQLKKEKFKLTGQAYKSIGTDNEDVIELKRELKKLKKAQEQAEHNAWVEEVQRNYEESENRRKASYSF